MGAGQVSEALLTKPAPIFHGERDERKRESSQLHDFAMQVQQHIYIYIYIYKCIHMYICTYTYLCMYVYIYTCIYVYIYQQMRESSQLHDFTMQVAYTHIYYILVYIYISISIYICLHICIYMYI